MSKFFLTFGCLLALTAAAISPAFADEVFTRKGQVPLVGSGQAARSAKPIVSGENGMAGALMAPRLAAPEIRDALIQGLAAIKHGHDGKDQTIDLAPKLQMMLKAHGAISPVRPFKGGGKLVQIANTRVSPYAAIGVVASGCSGALVMKRFVLTAPWCVYDSKAKKFYDNLDFTPAVNGADAPVGTIKWKNVWIPKGYQETGDLTFAFALIELAEDVGDKTGWFGFGPVPGSESVRQLTLSGYPFNGVPENTVWETKCAIDSAQQDAYFYHCPGDGKVLAGMCGAPVYAKGAKAGDSDQILGLHVSSQNDKQDSFWAMKLGDATTQTLLSWANEGKIPPEPQPETTPADQGTGSGDTPQCTCNQGNSDN